MLTRVLLWLLYARSWTSTWREVGDEAQFEGGLNPIIIPSLGVALKPSGLLASGADSLFASIFLSVPVPKTHKSECKRSTNECKPGLSMLSNILKRNPSRFMPLVKPKEDDETKLKHVLQCITKCLNDLNCKATIINPTSCSNYEIENNILSEDSLQVNMDTLGNRSDICNNLIKEPELSKIYRESMEAEIQNLWTTSHAAYNNLITAYNLKANSNVTKARKRRGVLMAAASIGLPLVSGNNYLQWYPTAETY